MHIDEINLAFTSKGIAYNIMYINSMFNIQYERSFPMNDCTVQLVHILGKYRLTLFG